MADDQVKYSDLIADDVVKGLELLNKALQDIKTTMAGVKEEAASLGVSLKNVSTATREQQQATAQNAASVDGLSKKVKQLTEEERMLESVRRQYKKLTDDQIARVDRLAVSLSRMNTADQSTVDHALKLIDTINIENKSYNELQATYNALMNAIKNMNTEQLRSSQIGKTMVATAKNIRETMNETQKSVGNYTLQVGKYRAAFDGLGYSFQQILREAPSALNLNQFFLAISNNIPMFLDQLKSFQNEQKEIKANLAQMTEGTKEYSEQLGKVMSVGQKLGKTLMSWQTLVLVGLLIIRNWEKIVNLFQKLFKKVEDGYNSLVRMRQVIHEIDANVESSISKTVVELTELNNRLASVTQGSEEWKNITERINEIMGDNYDLAGKMPGQIQQITQAYIAQAEQLAKNKFVIDKIAENAENSFKRQQIIESIVKNGDIESAAKRLGFEKGSDQYKALERVTNTAMPLPSATDPNEKVWEVVDGKPRRVGYDKFMTDLLNNYLDEELGRLFSNKELEELWNKYYKPMKERTDNDPSKEVKDEVDDFLTLDRLLKDEIIANIEDEYKREEAAEIARHTRFLEDRETELKKLAEDDPRRAVINKRIEEEEETHIRKMFEIDEKRRQELIKMSEDEKKAAEQAAKDEAKAKLKAMADGWQQQRAELVKEGKTRRELVEAEVAAEIARLNMILKLNRDVNGEKMSDEQRQKVEEWIALLEKIQKTGDYSNIKPGQVAGKGGANISTDKKNWSNIAEVMRDVLDVNITNEQISALNSVFDQAKEALNSWMDARKAAADQAKELADDEVSAAENALNREIELRNQGYANNVALRERELADAKEKQKQAVEEQKKIAQQQILLDAALQTSSLITASANIIKQFPNPLVWGPMLATMWGSFAFAKIKAYQASTKSIQFREGGVMLLNGGSHESGHDVNLGIGPDGSNLRAEGGEYFAVINKRNSRKYGSEIPAVVNALNSGMFEDRYIKTSDAVGLLPRIIRADDGSAVDLSAVESGVGQLVKQGESRWTVEGEYRVERYKNRVRRVKIG